MAKNLTRDEIKEKRQLLRTALRQAQGEFKEAVKVVKAAEKATAQNAKAIERAKLLLAKKNAAVTAAANKLDGFEESLKSEGSGT